MLKFLYFKLFTRLNEVSMKLAENGVEIPYKKFNKILWKHFIWIFLANAIADYAICSIIHPYGQPFIPQIKCLFVSIKFKKYMCINGQCITFLGYMRDSNNLFVCIWNNLFIHGHHNKNIH